MKPLILNNPQFPCADPFVLFYDNKYYLYATTDATSLYPYFNTANEEECGIRVFVSDNLSNWTYLGFALKRGDMIGEKNFWAPEITYKNGRFYMVYTAEEHIGIAISDKPQGPFKQSNKKWLSQDKIIDGHFFFDTDGTPYLFYVKLLPDSGNTIFGARLSDDLTEIDFDTERFLLKATDDWETIDSLVAEGPFVLKHNNTYFLTYSANHTRSQNYAVGYATSKTPLGPYEKYENNPVLKSNNNIVGVGHHSFITQKNSDKLICVYHCHNSKTDFLPRRLCIGTAEFKTENDKTVLRIDKPSEECTVF